MLTKKKLKANIEAVDKEIGEILTKLESLEAGDDYDKQMETMEKLIKVRDILSNNKVNESYKKEIIAGAISIAGMVLVLRYERADVIATKAFSMATNLFRG